MSWLHTLRDFLRSPQEPAHAPKAGDEKDFALALYRRLGAKSGNFCFSPFSIRVALAMTEAGARGETASQMREVLRGSSSGGADLHADLAAILGRLEASGGDLVELNVANSIWCQAGAPLEAKFCDAVTGHYGGHVSAVDFRRSAEAARVTINRWVGARTRDKIPELLARRTLDPDSRLVLVNAIYFKGRWRLEFSPQITRDEAFYLEDGGTVQAPLMRRTDEFRHVQAVGFQAVELDYCGGKLSMLVLLPERRDGKDGLRQLEAKLSAGLLDDCVAQMEHRTVRVLLPRFEIRSCPGGLPAVLSPLGMRRAFTREEADFSGINGLRPPDEEALFISNIVHQAFVEANEAGTEAAAATGLAFRAAGAAPGKPPPPPPEFRADHPFVFAIRERTSGEILFLGRVTDPTRGG